MLAAEAGWLNLSNSESPEFIGRVIAASQMIRRSSNAAERCWWRPEVAIELGVTDVDGRQPRPLTLDTV